jgi:hypothetical protein
MFANKQDINNIPASASAMAVDSDVKLQPEQKPFIQEWIKLYMTNIAHVTRGLINYIKKYYQETPKLSSSQVVSMRRLLSSAGHNSYEQYDEFAGTYGLNSIQDVGIVYKNGNSISVIRHSHESRPKFLKSTTKIVELAVACLYAIFFKTGKMFNTFNKIMVVCVSDVNPNRPSQRGWHRDLWPHGAWLKSRTDDNGVDSGIDKIHEVVTETLNNMNDGPFPPVVSIGFKTTGPTPIIITNIKENGKITYTTAMPARGDQMPCIYVDNLGAMHETPGPVDTNEMKIEFAENFPENEMPPDVIVDIDIYNDYVEQAKNQIRHFVRKCFSIRLNKRVDEMIRQMDALKEKLISSAAITIIDGVITIQNPYVLNDLEANLNETFPNWDTYSITDGFNLLQRLSGTSGSKVNISELELQGCPDIFHLIRHKKFILTDPPKKKSRMTKETKEIKDYGYGGYDIDGTYVSGPYTGDRPIVPKDLTVYQEVSVMNIDNLVREVNAVIASQNNPSTTRTVIDPNSITGRPTHIGGKSRSKTKQKRNKRRNTKKKYYFKKRRSSQKKNNKKRRSRKR